MSQTKKSRAPRHWSLVHPAAAAIDIGATMHVAAVGPDRDEQPVRTFRTFTDDLERLADWFARCGIKTIAMESTTLPVLDPGRGKTKLGRLWCYAVDDRRGADLGIRSPPMCMPRIARPCVQRRTWRGSAACCKSMGTPGSSGRLATAGTIRSSWRSAGRTCGDGRIEMDTNVVERSIRPVTLTRKNALSAGSDGGAWHWSIAMILIETAKLNGVEPMAWLTDVLERVVSGRTKASGLEALLSWNWRPAPADSGAGYAAAA